METALDILEKIRQAVRDPRHPFTLEDAVRLVKFLQPFVDTCHHGKERQTMTIERILWPTDFSENAAAAFPLVTALVEKFGAEIHILYVLKDYPAFGAHYGDYDPQEQEKMRQWEKETAEKRLDELCNRFLDTCPLYKRHIRVGDPAKEILKMVQSESIDMVVMANRGSESHFDFGSVADRVLKCTSVPVVMVPA